MKLYVVFSHVLMLDPTILCLCTEMLVSKVSQGMLPLAQQMHITQNKCMVVKSVWSCLMPLIISSFGKKKKYWAKKIVAVIVPPAIARLPPPLKHP